MEHRAVNFKDLENQYELIRYQFDFLLDKIRRTSPGTETDQRLSRSSTTITQREFEEWYRQVQHDLNRTKKLLSYFRKQFLN